MALLVASAMALPVMAEAQSTTAGVLEGTVRSAAGVALAEVQITVRHLRSGLPRVLETDRDGRFSAPLLKPGEYEVLAEQLGYQPVVVGPIPVRVSRRSDVRITLEGVRGVVESPVRVPFGGAVVGGSRPGRITVIPAWERSALPFREGEVLELLRTASSGEPDLEVQGLPSSLSEVSVDGIGVPVAGDPSPATGHGLPPILFPVRTASETELISGPQDVEWPSVAGSILALTSRSGSRELAGELGGDWTSDAVAIDESPTLTSWRGALSAGGAVAGDKAHVWVDVRALQRERPASYIPIGAAGTVDGLGAAGVDLAPLQRRNTAREERASAAATIDWSFDDGRSVQMSAQYAEGSSQSVLGSTGVPIPAAVDGSDLLLTTAATAGLAEGVDLEVRLGFGVSSRSRDATGPVDTRFDRGAVVVGPAGIQLGGIAERATELRRSGIDGQAIVHFRGEEHHVKVGAGLGSDRHEQSRGYDRQSAYLFGDAAAYADGTGALFRTEGDAPTAEFSMQEYFAFGQDTWRLAPGLDLTTGIRYDLGVLPTDRLLRNRRWLQLTGIDNTDVNRSTSALGFVMGFEWDVQEAHEWLVRAGGAVHTGDLLPGVLAEGLTHHGLIEAFGVVGDVDDPSALQSLGPRLTVLGPSVEPPVTNRVSVGLTRALGPGTALSLSAVLRQTENLPRRRDLNLRTEPNLTDQYGRPVYGPLERAGTVLQAAPGGNRRFNEFDAVSAITTDASSTYWGVTAAVERQAGERVRLTGRYTYSRTRDDWVDPAPGHTFLTLPPFPATSAMADWQEGTSYFDVPHRAAAAFEVRPPPGRVVSLGGVFRFSSGRPFTPGMGRGVDANADGVSGNDPAFVDPELDGMEPLLDQWSCLSSSVGRFVERNSCRLPDRMTVDAWIGVRWPPVGGLAGELRVEGLGLVADGDALYDTALLGVDPGGTVEVDPATDRITVPVRVNPLFGQRTIPGSELSRIRISMRLWF